MSELLKKPIIFLGFPRSGTSIISEIVFQHQELGWLSQYQDRFPNNAKINLVRNFFENSLWKIRGQKNMLNNVPLLNRYVFRPSEAYAFWNRITEKEFGKSFLFQVKAKEEKIIEIRSFFEKMVKYQRRERLAFKLTGPSRLMYLNSIFPDACFIRIKRKPLPTIRSLLKVGFWNEEGGKEGFWWNTDVYTNDELALVEISSARNKKVAFLAALQYYKIDEIHLQEQEYMNANILEINYENLISSPNDTIQEILHFLELEKDKRIDTYLAKNKIYNRNKKRKFYIRHDLDSKVQEIALNGVKNHLLPNN